MNLLHCFVVSEEMVVGSATFGILYNFFPNVTIKTQDLDSYTTCRFQKYVWPNNTSQTSRGEMSHNTSSIKGLMLYRRWHSWLTQISHPLWSYLMVYGCGCVVVGKPSRFMTFDEMRFFRLPLSAWTIAGDPLPTSRIGRGTPPPRDIQVPPSRVSWGQRWPWDLH